jgi:hypothetical protein
MTAPVKIAALAGATRPLDITDGLLLERDDRLRGD